MAAKLIAAALVMVLLAGCATTDTAIDRAPPSRGSSPWRKPARTLALIGGMVSSRSGDVVVFSDQVYDNVWVLWNGSRFFQLGHGDFCVTPNGKYVVSTDRDRPDSVLIAELDPGGTRVSTVSINLPAGTVPQKVGCDDVRAVVECCLPETGTRRDPETWPKSWKQIRLADLHVSEATQADWDGLPPEVTVPGEEVAEGECHYKVSKERVIVEKEAPAIASLKTGPNRIFLESGGKRTLLLEEDWWSLLIDRMPKPP